jgi:hypothetical protein
MGIGSQRIQYLEQNAPASLIDEISRTGLLKIGQGFWTFRHEVMGQFFAAIALERSGANYPLLRITNGYHWSEYQLSIFRVIGVAIAKGMFIDEVVA